MQSWTRFTELIKSCITTFVVLITLRYPSGGLLIRNLILEISALPYVSLNFLANFSQHSIVYYLEQISGLKSENKFILNNNRKELKFFFCFAHAVVTDRGPTNIPKELSVVYYIFYSPSESIKSVHIKTEQATETGRRFSERTSGKYDFRGVFS